MSMLAERRRKTKWVINPTKKPLWTTESNGIKFGKELMEKMGWSAGKGLGAKEQGIQEPLKVSYKNDTKGMGFKGNDDDWIEQQDEFNVFLNQLRSSDDSSLVKVSEEKNEIKSLEEKSKQSRARVHYQKFTRGKDLSRYSENDLACILGTNKIKKEKSKTEEVVETEEKSDEGLVTSFGVTTINSGSIQDYFKRKWITDKVKSKNVEKEKEEHSCDERPSFSRVFEESGEFSKKEDGALDGCEINGDSGEKYEKRKKRKKKDVQTSEEEEPKIKRKKTAVQDNPMDEELQNLAVGGDKVETENLLRSESNCDSRQRKKEKKKSEKEEGLEGSEEAEGLEVKKKRKKERKEKQVENGYCDTEELASIDCSLQAECPERKEELVKKKKKGKTGNEVFSEAEKENVEEPSFGVSMGEVNDAVEEDDVTVAKGKKKRKYKDHGGNVGVDVVSEKNELGSHVCEGDNEVGSKKKKKKKEKQYEKVERCGKENGISCEIRVEECDSGNSKSITDLEMKKKKKKKEKPEGDKVEYHRNESGCSSYEKYDGGNSNAIVELEVKKKKKKNEKLEGRKLECSSNGNEIHLEECDNKGNPNSTPELEEFKKKKKKKEKKENKMECCSGLPGEIPVGKCDSGNNSNSTTELEETKKKKKKKEKQEDKVECSNSGNEISSEILLGKSGGENNPNNTQELEAVKKKKKKEKHKAKEEESESNDMKGLGLDEAHQESVNGFSDTVRKKKKKKEKKEKTKCRDEGLSEEEEEERKDKQSTNGEVGSDAKRKKKKCEKEESKEEGKEKVKVGEGNAEIGTTAGIDKVELICQRAAYEHVAGQHRYERVKKMIEFVNLSRFRGSNLECLDGYGNRLGKSEQSVR